VQLATGVGNSDAKNYARTSETRIRRRLELYTNESGIAGAPGRAIRGQNAERAAYRGANSLQGATLVRRRQIGRLQLGGAATLGGMENNRTAIHHSMRMAVRSRFGRSGIFRASLRGTKWSTGRRNDQSQKRNQTGKPCQPSLLSWWRDTSHAMISTLRHRLLGVNLAFGRVVQNKQGVTRRNRGSLCR
jgi:hypothetical protein